MSVHHAWWPVRPACQDRAKYPDRQDSRSHTDLRVERAERLHTSSGLLRSYRA
jgi:hypothetical protein